MRLFYKGLLIAFVAAICNVGVAQVVDKPANPSPIVDLAGIIKNDSLVNALNAQLDTLSKQTKNQIVVVTVSDLGGLDAMQYATMLGNKWGIGGKDLNNGLVILIKPKNDKGEGDIGFATGYGLEGVLPDVECNRIENECIIPHFKDGDYAAGIKAAIDEIVPLVLKDYQENQLPATEAKSKKSGGGKGWIILAVIVGVIIILVILSRRNKKKTLATAQQPSQASQLKAEEPAQEQPKEEPAEEPEETDEDENPDDEESTVKPDEPKPYKYDYGGGKFGGGGASTKF